MVLEHIAFVPFQMLKVSQNQWHRIFDDMRIRRLQSLISPLIEFQMVCYIVSILNCKTLRLSVFKTNSVSTLALSERVQMLQSYHAVLSEALFFFIVFISLL